MTDTVALAVVTAVSSILAATVTTVGTIFLAKINRAQGDQAAKVEAVRVDLKKQDEATTAALGEISKTGKDSHTLLNANMGVQMKISAVALREVANLRGTPEAIQAAELAEHAYEAHMKQQALVDRDRDRERERGQGI